MSVTNLNLTTTIAEIVPAKEESPFKVSVVTPVFNERGSWLQLLGLVKAQHFITAEITAKLPKGRWRVCEVPISMGRIF